ncbi:MAG TPA: phenylalanine--tRNA ligase subunit beta, partial [Rickettsiales bacterium]|nr:phenylalanine--tRNA ligase subunit beta [Rickettsiales bacterium]
DEKPKEIEFNLKKIVELIGVEVPDNKALEILQNLGFEYKRKSSQKFLVKIPSYRTDIEGEADLVEEVIRIYGYDKIISQQIAINPTKPNVDILDKIRQTLIANNMIENINWSFCDVILAKNFTEIQENLTLRNPISENLNYMRPNLVLGLLTSYQKNYLRGYQDVSFFEIGNVFAFEQKMMIAGLRIGKNKEQNHYNDQRDFDIFDVKKDIFDLFEIFGLQEKSLQISDENAPKYYHPHRFGALKLGKNIVGYFGEIHPKIAKIFDLKIAINIFEIFVDNLPSAKNPIKKKAFEHNDLQPIWRDFAFLLDASQKVGDLAKTIENCEKNLIKQVDIFDIYQGENIDVSKKSVALRVKIQPEKNLTGEEIETISTKIVDAVISRHRAVLRG